MTISLLVYWAAIFVLGFQTVYHLDGWRIDGKSHRLAAAFSCGAMAVALLLELVP